MTVINHKGLSSVYNEYSARVAAQENSYKEVLIS